jgi:ketosteroid isomerase-like protein
MNSSVEEDAMNPEEVFMLFVMAVNRHDTEALTSLMAADHIFIDSLGRRAEGAVSMQAGWRRYFAMCRDYWIRTDTVMAEESTVLAVGEAGGSIDGIQWRTPAAWKAVIREGKVAEWHVFADNKPVYEILAKR